MKSNYKRTHQLIAYALLFSLFLQSCGTFSNQSIPQIGQTKQKEKVHGITQGKTITSLVDQEFTAEKGYLVSFHEQEGNLQADVKTNATQDEFNYTNVSVVLAQGVCLTELPHLEKTIQQRSIQVERTSSGRPNRIVVARGGLKGGMMEGDDEDQKEKESLEEEGQVYARKRMSLLKNAMEGKAKSQFKLGKKAYYAWVYQYRKEAAGEAKFWLGKALEQHHKKAIELLNKITQVAS